MTSPGFFVAAANFNGFCRLDIQCQHTDKNTRCNPDLNMCQCLPRYKPQRSGREKWCMGERFLSLYTANSHSNCRGTSKRVRLRGHFTCNAPHCLQRTCPRPIRPRTRTTTPPCSASWAHWRSCSSSCASSCSYSPGRSSAGPSIGRSVRPFQGYFS